ncbi:TolC family outer membrane protein [Phyllobacterium sp. 628]|uniref:TolC family outer membrane protein n=1 Tax=Phyllobacterium sp. 628 TaxID=2718938 RepID=UPI00166256F8|nr:TolC family outer membrane protein [Phyllobacterium sp. 628]QND53186.1 TolC family outer membrane protein [Phyllobacterium sp. 628]
MKGFIVFIAGKRVLTAALLSATVLTTTPSMAETILGAMAKAYQNNSTVNADRAGVRVTDEGVAVAKSGYRPTVSATAEFNTQARRLDGGSNSHSNTGTFGITINQMLFDGFQTKNNVASAKTQVLAARENLRNNEQNLLFSAAQAYMDVYQARQIAVLRQKNLEFLDEQLRAAKARFDVGEGTRTDVAQAEAEKASAIATLNVARADVKTAEATYIQIVGAAPNGLKSAGMATRNLPKSMDSAFNVASAGHPAILATQYALDAAGYSVKSNEGALLPQIGLSGVVQRNEFFSGTQTTDSVDSTTATAGLTLTIPIYSGGRTPALVRQAKETAAQRRIEVDVARDSVRQAIAKAWSQMEAAKASIIAQKTVISASQLALNGVIEERKVGQRTTLDVLNAQATVLTGQIALAQAEHDSVVTSYAVLLAVGRLSPSQIGLQVAEYKPQEHYDAVQDKWFGLRTPDGR